MKYIICAIVFTLSLIISTAVFADKEKWVTVLILQEQGIAHDIDLESIKVVSESKFIFVHRLRLRSPVPGPDSVTFDTLVVLSSGNCKKGTTVMEADIAFLGTAVVGQNLLSKTDKESIPEEGSIHDVVLTNVCPKLKITPI